MKYLSFFWTWKEANVHNLHILSGCLLLFRALPDMCHFVQVVDKLEILLPAAVLQPRVQIPLIEAADRRNIGL